jgi:GNAT superfamily N-acetyltransferase
MQPSRHLQRGRRRGEGQASEAGSRSKASAVAECAHEDDKAFGLEFDEPLILSVMLDTRRAKVEDGPIITKHRKAMFADANDAPEVVLDAMSRSFEPWVTRMIEEGKYSGWITFDEELGVASAGLLVLDWAPHFLDPTGQFRGYLLNVFVEPEYRKRGLARTLVELCMAEAKRRGIRVVALHASKACRRVYEGMGFHGTSEMMFVNLDEEERHEG